MDDRLFAGVLPSSGATIGDPGDRARRVVALWVERLFDTLDAWHRPRPLAEWSRALRDAFTRLLVPDRPDDLDAFDRLLATVDALGAVWSARRLPAATWMFRWWQRLDRAIALADDSVGSGFLVGGMTVCALKPMRSIPFRVIAIAGLDDASFPRRNRRAAYDLLEIDPRRGDRNLRADDRQLFLDTLLCARDRLILSYVGRSAKNAPSAPPRW